ncbi:uncharacterized protein K02A2.6-like [Dendrobium catenatum]|uniref:uncharacterized protein K02A2.6-like n=1 Tax=Dendrobium catenatum TaxID=906689 RepID=UPI0009F3B839|nr:uncharacterized protein K02A2.6-like [Dendrobium catenatum]
MQIQRAWKLEEDEWLPETKLRIVSMQTNDNWSEKRNISDNGSAFKSTKINSFVRRHNIDWRYSTIYYPRANGLAEAFNKTFVQIVKKTLDDNKRQWDERLVEALWAYRTTYRTLTQSTPFALVYRSEAVLPLEIQIPSLKIAVHNQITNEQNAKLRLEELEGLKSDVSKLNKV